MKTPYERGWQQGYWTPERLRIALFRSAQACLDNAERRYEEELEKALGWTDQDAAAKHRDYMTGMITRTRQDLAALIKAGY